MQWHVAGLQICSQDEKGPNKDWAIANYFVLGLFPVSGKEDIFREYMYYNDSLPEHIGSN